VETYPGSSPFMPTRRPKAIEETIKLKNGPSLAMIKPMKITVARKARNGSILLKYIF